MKMPAFLRKTPAESAGLLPSMRQPASSIGLTDEEIWERVKASPEVAAMEQRYADAWLAQRRELVAKLESARRENQRLRKELADRRAAAEARMLKAEEDFRAAIAAVRSLPMGDPGQSEVFQIERELSVTADPRLSEFQAWLQAESAYTTSCMPAMGASADDRSVGFDQQARKQLIARSAKLNEIACEVRDVLKYEALSPEEGLDAMRKLFARIPPLPANISSPGRPQPVPDFITVGKSP